MTASNGEKLPQKEMIVDDELAFVQEVSNLEKENREGWKRVLMVLHALPMLQSRDYGVALVGAGLFMYGTVGWASVEIIKDALSKRKKALPIDDDDNQEPWQMEIE